MAVLASRADSTVTKYIGASQRLRAWAQQCKEVQVFPLSEVHFSLYWQQLSELTHSWSAAQDVVNAIGWVNQVSGWAPIVQSTFVQDTVAGRKKEPSNAYRKMVASNGKSCRHTVLHSSMRRPQDTICCDLL